jgi:predicted aldo/keto reductase-like oxidoreductase
LEQLDVCLDRLNTTYIDCMMIHGIGRPELGDMRRIQNPAVYEAYDEAKKSGKVRFTGASSCGPKVLEEMEWGIDNDRFDVILLGANFLTHGLEKLLKKAKARGVATMAMKSMTTFKKDLPIRELVNKQTNARQAVLKYVLASDLFDTLIISMANYDQINEYLSVSGTTSLEAEDEDTLELLASVIGTRYCRPGCDECYGSCPQNVPIWDILRYKMYFENYGKQKYAMERYNRIPSARKPVSCADCDAPCERACAYNVEVRNCLIEAHHLLTFA